MVGSAVRSATAMSVKYTEAHDDSREWKTCDICTGRYVTHKHYERRIKYPDNVCIWCFSRHFGKKTGLYYRWETMSRAIHAIAKVDCQKDGAEDCKCITCFARLTIGKVWPNEAVVQVNNVTVADGSEDVGLGPCLAEVQTEPQGGGDGDQVGQVPQLVEEPRLHEGV